MSAVVAKAKAGWRRHPWLATTTGAGIVVLATVGAVRGARLTIPYLVIVLVMFLFVSVADESTRFSTLALVGLAAWALLHLAGGLIELDDGRILYNTLFTRWIHFDNVVHFIGFGSAGLAGGEALAASLGVRLRPRTAWVVACTAAMAAGALNEVVEFAATHVLGATEVGGYENTGRDLVANMLGGCLAGTWAARRLAKGAEQQA